MRQPFDQDHKYDDDLTAALKEISDKVNPDIIYRLAKLVKDAAMLPDLDDLTEVWEMTKLSTWSNELEDTVSTLTSVKQDIDTAIADALDRATEDRDGYTPEANPGFRNNQY